MVKIKLLASGEIRNKHFSPELFHSPALIEFALNQQPEGGLTMEDVRKRNKVFDKLDKAKSKFDVTLSGTLELEDSEYETLKICVKNAKYPAVEKQIELFYDSVMNPEPVKAKP